MSSNLATTEPSVSAPSQESIRARASAPEFLSDASPKDKPWDARRSECQSLEGRLADAHSARLAGRMRACAPWLTFAQHTNTETGEWSIKLHKANFCRVRHCPVCQWRRSLMHKARFIQSLPKVFEQVPHTARWILLTLTVKNCAIGDLKAAILDMQAAFRRLTKRTEFSHVLGWIRATEVTRAADDTAHPHMHVLLLVSPSYFDGKHYVKQSLWQRAWQEAARLDYQPVVDVRAIKLSRKKREEREAAAAAGLPVDHEHIALAATAAAEVLKYATKATDLIDAPTPWLMTYISQVHKLRFLGPGGVLKKALQDESDDDDLVHVGEGEDGDDEKEPDTMHFVYGRQARRYARETTEA